ncbi:MAG: TraB/GumN family protein [Xanthomonadales bacterium]|nr:TraB/GumN family protein [Xanthomonadales bacterium]
MKVMPTFCTFALILPGIISAAVETPSSGIATAPTHVLREVEVVADRPPPMWELRRDGKRIVFFGTHYPLLKRARFNQNLVEAYAKQADVFVHAPGLVVDDSVSIWRGLTLWSSIRRAKRLPKGSSLRDVLSPKSYERWIQFRERYMGNDKDSEQLRPMYAAYELYRSATKRVAIAKDSLVVPLIERLAKEKHVNVVDARIHIPVVASKVTAKAFDVKLEDDVACLEETLELIDPFMEYAPAAADAWANGDIDRLQAVTLNYPQPSFCWATLTNQAFANLAGLEGAHAHVTEKWIKKVYSELENHETVFTYFSARGIIERKGVIQALLADGWNIRPLVAEDDTAGNRESREIDRANP